MNAEHWERVKDVLATAMDLTGPDRASYIDARCGDDDELRGDVEALLSHERAAGSRFLNHIELAQAAVALLPENENLWIGRRVGAYQVAELIGAGGMGEVYRAFRCDDQYEKQVALKLIRSGQDSAMVVARFRNERQILAGLEHPNIARLLEGGTTEEGLPYLVMELIEGQPIDQYCETRKLSVPQRLRLFLAVCSAVQYAHQSLIIHRDLKPGNILVTEDGVPKLLDFGIAKILEAENGSDQASSTVTMLRVLTPQYASPEQVRGQPITTASDVYSLGVILYQLLTGQGPYGSEAMGLEDAIRAVCDTEVLRPSTAVRSGSTGESSLPPDSALGFEAKGSQQHNLAKQLRGDLDNIILMALRKEPQRRYSSVDKFAEDVRRHLQNLPVIARKDTSHYRASKFMRRHKTGVVAAGIVALVLIAGILITLQEARIAKRRFEDVRTLANSLIFDVHDSIKDLPGATPARKIIVERALQYLNVLANESAGDRQLQRELATAYEKVAAVQGDYLESNLGDLDGALASYRRALDLRKRIAAGSLDWSDQLALAQAYHVVAHQMWADGDPRGAREPIARAIAISSDLNGRVPNNAKILYELGFEHEVSGRIGYPGDPAARDKILQDYRRALSVDETLIRVLPGDAKTLHGYSMDLGDIGVMLEQIDPKEALKNYQKGLEIDQKLVRLSTDIRYRRSVAIGYGSIASAYDDLGEYAQALDNNLKDLAIYKEMVVADPKNALLQQGLAITYMNTASSYLRVRKIASALDYSSRALDIMRPLASSARGTAFQQGVFAAMLAARGTILTGANQPQAAEGEVEKGRSIYETLARAGTITRANIAACDVKLGQAATAAGKSRKAGDYFNLALTTAEPLISTDPPDADALYAAADAYSGLGDLSMMRASARGLTTNTRLSNRVEARSWYELSLSTWHRIKQPNHSAPNGFQVGDPTRVAEALTRIDADLSSRR